MKHVVEKRSRQSYTKPRLAVIELAADEVLVTFCKNDNASGPGFSQCKNPFSGNPCSLIGGISAS
jgi:hypothetical protein